MVQESKAELGRNEDGPTPLDLTVLRRKERKARIKWAKAQRHDAGESGWGVFLAFCGWIWSRIELFVPVRVVQNYGLTNGTLAAAGVAFRMFFSIGSLVVAGLGIGGMVLNGYPEIRDEILKYLDRAVPGVFSQNGHGGLVDPGQFLNNRGLSWTVVIALVVALFGALGWIGGLRDGMLQVAGLLHVKDNPLLRKVKDLLVLVVLATVLIGSAAISLISTNVLGDVLRQFGLDWFFELPMVTMVAGLLLNWLTAAILVRYASGIKFFRRATMEGTLLSGVLITIMQAVSGQLLTLMVRNPVMASIGIAVVVLAWFYLLSHAYLVGTSWATIRNADMLLKSPAVTPENADEDAEKAGPATADDESTDSDSPPRPPTVTVP